MTTLTRNEAAERLCDALHAGCQRYHERMAGMGLPIKALHDPSEHLREAEELLPVLAAERRATVERIRERLIPAMPLGNESPLGMVSEYDIRRALDEEAAR